MSEGFQRIQGEPEKRRELLRLVNAVYRPDGVRLWLAQAEKNGWTLDEQIIRARQLAEGTF